MSKYDFFVAGRWRNRDAINEVVKQLRAAGKTCYCFTESEYDGHGIKFESNPEADTEAMISATEHLADWQTNLTFREIFETDMQAERDAAAFILVFPAGLASHMELGAAYGMGKPCYAIGEPEKTETLHLMLDGVFPDVASLLQAQQVEVVR